MRADSYTPDDLELLGDLERAAQDVGVEPCLIGAGAIRLGPALEWDVRPRMTDDWDFAVRVDSWSSFDQLAQRLTRADGGFEQARERHRFRHRLGGKLDIVPYGDLETPEGFIQWGGGVVMDTRGLDVLDGHYGVRRIESVELRVASVPAIVGLKFLAYRSRRPGTTRDIGDAHRLIVEVEDTVDDARIEAEALDRLTTGSVSIGEVGAYLLGRDVARAFDADDTADLRGLLDEASDEASRMIPDILRAPDSAGVARERVLERFAAFQAGIVEG